jgi:hypothetical protein
MPMQELWTFPTEVDADVIDLTGFDVEARDGGIGHIDEATNEVAGSYVIVDTGPWIFGKQVMIPAGAIERIDLEGRTVHVGLTKDQIKASPEFDGEIRSEDQAYRERIGAYYGPFLGDPLV